MEDPSILFLGTPEFAAESLIRIIKEGYPLKGVVTAPDRPAGRGLRMKMSSVKEVALNFGIRLFQPLSLKDPDFIRALEELKPDLGVVIAFRMLPRAVWSIPRLGTFNLHASLLPQYRGAAPINRVIMNGEKKTGLTTFLLDEQIDTGRILYREEVEIGDEDTALELHDRMKVQGSDLVIKTIKGIRSGIASPVEQSALTLPGEELKAAPKIIRTECRINWESDVFSVRNMIRGLSPVPGAYTSLVFRDGSLKEMKVFRAGAEVSDHADTPGTVISDGIHFLKIAALNGYIHLKEIQLEGRKPMAIGEFLKGAGFHFV